MAIERIQTDHGPEFETDFFWHLRDLGVIHRQIPRGYPDQVLPLAPVGPDAGIQVYV